MNKQLIWRCAPLSSVALLLLSAPVLKADPNIAVDVDNQAISFQGAPPVEVGGSVLVPLRGVFEAMGASVDYDSPSKTITAQKGPTTVILQIGSTMASVNGQTEMLSQPARVSEGTTLVPLRFVAQALGAEVNWNAPINTVQIYTQQQNAAAGPVPAAPSVVFGRVTDVDPNSNPPQITVSHDGTLTVVPIMDSTIILVSPIGEPGVQSPLDRVRLGDEAKIQLDSSGNAETVSAVYSEIRGEVKSTGVLANGDYVVTLENGDTVELAPKAFVTGDRGPMDFRNVSPGQVVEIRANPKDQMGYALVVEKERMANNGPGGGPINPIVQPAPHTVQPAPHVVQPAPNVVQPAPRAVRSTSRVVQPTIDSFSDDATRPLRSGDVLTVRLTGTPSGQASFGIPGVVNTVPMSETSPGKYQGSYTVGRNLRVNGASVLGKLQVNGATAPTIQASNSVTIDNTPPTAIASGPPVAPRIVSPRNGSTVGTMLTVQGTAAPGSTVAVTVNYFDTAPGQAGMLSGFSATKQVRADANGSWSAANIPLQSSKPIGNAGNAIYTITATAQNATGETSQPVRITVRP